MNGIEAYLRQFYDELEPKEFYRLIFPEGELEAAGEMVPGKYTGVIVQITREKKQDGRPKIKRYSLCDDLAAVDTVTATDDFCICSPISYAGKERTAKNARYCYGIAIDVDKVKQDPDGGPLGLRSFLNRHVDLAGRLPKPTAIVSSGSGFHVYYIFHHALPMFPNIAEQLQALKRELTRLIWHDTITDIKSADEIQQEGIYQGFRMPGTITKSGSRACAFLTGEKVFIETLNNYVKPEYQVTNYKYKSNLPLAEAKEKYPEWYERRIEQGQKRGRWNNNRALYEWWKRQILEGATVGHRYYCLMILAIYARKCSVYDAKHNPEPVTYKELERDALELWQHMETLTETEDNHFTTADMLDALEAFNEDYVTYPRDEIQRKSAIIIPANKRNGQKQADHLEEARAIRDIRMNRQGRKWDDNNGRKSKRTTVEEWQQTHPEGKKADCCRDTGLTKPTVYKYWKSQPE